MEKKSFILYTDMNSFIKAMSDEQAGKLMKLVYSYACGDDVDDNEDGMVNATFNYIKIKMDACSLKYEEKRKKASESAKKRWDKNAQEDDANACERIKTQCDTMLSVSDSDSDSVSVSDTDKEKSKTKVLPKKLGSRFDLSKHVNDDWLHEAVRIRPELSKQEINEQLETFTDYWNGVAGAKGVKLDWIATWRNWIRRADAKKPRKSSNNNFNVNDWLNNNG